MSKCKNARCSTCPRMIIAHSIYNRKLGYNIVLPHNSPSLTCTTKRVVYVIKCKVHHKAYVGQITKTVKERINRHMTLIKRGNRIVNMVHHFTGPDCSLSNLTFAPIQQVTENIEAEANFKEMETLWIQRFCSLQPWGMNYIERDTDIRTRDN